MCLATSQPIIIIKGQTKNSVEIEFLDIWLWFFTFWTIVGFESNRKENPAMFKYGVGDVLRRPRAREVASWYLFPGNYEL